MPPVAAARKAQAVPDSNRRQSGRQIRTSISRPVNYYARPYGSYGGPADETQDDSPPGFFPAVQYFTDAITALPKETQRHFTLMKEVEAKIHGPSEAMTQITQKIMGMPVPPRRSRQPSRQALLSFTAHNSSAATSANGSLVNGIMPPPRHHHSSDADELMSQATQIDPQADMARRQEFYNLRMVIQSILINLDEKNVCLAEANRTLDRQLARVESVIPHVESEISEEARLGSLTHWAYADNRVKNKAGPIAQERTRRDVAATNSLAAAAQSVHEGDIAAARGEARREAKKSRNQQVDSEFEDRTVIRKTQAAKGRKAAEPAASSKGLGIVNGGPAAQAPKRRKVEKEGAVAMERTMSGALKTAKAASGTASRSTPVAELVVKKKATKAAPAPLSKKRNVVNSPQQSPRMAQSPLVGNFAIMNETQRSTSARMRQNSSTLQHSTLADANQARPTSAAGVRPANGDRGRKESATKSQMKEEQGDRMDIDGANTSRQVDGGADVKQDGGAEADEGNAEPRSRGRLLKIGPAGTDHDSVAMVRTRSNGVRSSEPGTNAQKIQSRHVEERSHSRSSSNQHILKQIASFNRSPLQSRRELSGSGTGEIPRDEAEDEDSPEEDETRPRRRATSRRNRAATPDEDIPPPEPEDVGEEMDEEEENDHDPDDPNEPKYCYCGRGSYGQMIACDNPNCEKEWFHLDCTGLRTPPAENVKWFCHDCDPKARKKSRPMSRH